MRLTASALACVCLALMSMEWAFGLPPWTAWFGWFVAFGGWALVGNFANGIANERERIARLAEEMRPHGGRAWSEGQLACWECLTDLSEYIRTGFKLPE